MNFKRLTGLTSITAYLLSGLTVCADDSSAPDYRPLNLSFGCGTTGLAPTVTLRSTDQFGEFGGFDYFNHSRIAAIENIPGNAHLQLMSQTLTLNLFPGRSGSIFFSSGAYFNQNLLAGNTSDGFTANGNYYPPSDEETVHLKCPQQAVNPYVSVGGKLHLDAVRHWALGFEMGLLFTGESQVSLVGSEGLASSTIDAALDQQKQMLQDNLAAYQFLPVVKVSVCYSF